MTETGPLNAVSLFTNCGAGDFGYRKAGFRFRVLAEIDARRLSVAALNHPGADLVPGDLRSTWDEVVDTYSEREHGHLDLLAACPPCQGMSTAKRDRGSDDDPEAGARDGRNLLVVPIAKVTTALEPRVVVVENVPPFLTRQVPHPETGKGVSAASLLISLLEDEYEVFPFLADLCDFGVPQHRERAFLTFVRRDLAFLTCLRSKNLTPYPRPTHAQDHSGAPVTLGQSLDELDANPLDASDRDSAQSAEDGPLHTVPVLSDRLYQMVAAIPGGTGASAWENSECGDCGEVDVEEDDAICPRCQKPLHRPVVEQEDGSYRLVKGFRSSSYRRMDPEAPATTVTTANGRIGSSSTIHPRENRVLSALECAHIQTIPNRFNWGESPCETIGVNELRAMIGEAVPPLFTQKHGTALAGCLGSDYEGDLVSSDDHRCGAARRKLGLEARSAA